MTLEAPLATIRIPVTHIDLLERPICAVFTTLGRDGAPESSLVWVDHDGSCARINTTLERRKGRNLAKDPRASLLIVDPDDTSRYLQIRGDVELVTAGAMEHLDRLTRKYTGHAHYYGDIRPAGLERRETRVMCRLHAVRVTTDAIHA